MSVGIGALFPVHTLMSVGIGALFPVHTLMSVGIGALFSARTRMSVRPLRPQSTHARACGLSGARRPSSAWERRKRTGSDTRPPTSRRAPGPRRGARNSAGGSTHITSRVIWERFRVLAVGAARRGRTAAHVPTRGRPHAAPRMPLVCSHAPPRSPCRRRVARAFRPAAMGRIRRAAHGGQGGRRCCG